MSRLNPDKLSVKFCDGVTPISPIIPRLYTLTHSDITGELFLTIGKNYAYDEITPMRDEVLGKWILKNNKYFYLATVYVDGKFGPERAAIRNKIFMRELPLALEAIAYGDRAFLNTYPFLKHAPIYVYFKSSYPQYNRIEYFGTFKDFETLYKI